jgi:glycosyltransferase involved in cell wall biosynthesis
MKADVRVKLFQAEPRGIAHAMNEGIIRSSGEIIQHLHSNDLLYDKEILGFVDSMFGKQKDMTVLSGRSARLVEGEVQHRVLSPSSFRRRKMLLRYLIYVTCYINHPSTFVKRSVFERHGTFNEDFRISMDYEFWLRILRNEKFLLVNKELAVFREHDDAASSDPEKNRKEEILARKLHSRNLDAFIGKYLIGPVVKQKMKLNTLHEYR